MCIDELEDCYWRLVHRLNGELLRQIIDLIKHTVGRSTAHPGRVARACRWKPDEWICNTVVLRRRLRDTATAVFQTSATYFAGEVVDDETGGVGVGGLNRFVPLEGTFTALCVNTGNVVWADSLCDIKCDPRHPLYAHYRPWEYVSVRNQFEPRAEYVFPIRIHPGFSAYSLGVVNFECAKAENPFATWGQAYLTHLLLEMLDIHGAFLVAAEYAAGSGASHSGLLNSHKSTLVHEKSQKVSWWRKAGDDMKVVVPERSNKLEIKPIHTNAAVGSALTFQTTNDDAARSRAGDATPASPRTPIQSLSGTPAIGSPVASDLIVKKRRRFTR